jgi:hypothetical protein
LVLELNEYVTAMTMASLPTRDSSNNENWYYSDVFSSGKPLDQLSGAYGKFVHATYPSDFKPTGTATGNAAVAA